MSEALWSDLESRCRDCLNCPLGKSRTNLVFGAGNREADLMFVGEAPGQAEDEQGIPFVGAAGKLLDRYLFAVGIPRESVYIANILKCRPPMNRDPLPEEEDACIGYLREQVRQIVNSQGQRIFYLGTLAGFTDVLSEQVSYKNVGEKVREYCLKFGWGYRVILYNGILYFSLYKGTDRTASVIFSDNYENLIATKYLEDDTNMGNVALVAGEGQGSARSRNVSGYEQSVNRYEVYVDAKDISKTITWGDLIAIYPTTDSGGQGYISGSAAAGYTYKLNYLNVQIIDNDQLTWLQTNFPSGQQVTIGGVNYYQVYNEAVANIPSNSPDSGDNVTLTNIVYSVYLLTRGYEKLAEYGAVTSFEGTIEPNTTFIYKQDYFLGDLVTVENEYGISVGARITEVIEVSDDTGYSVQPKFEYISEV